MIEEIISRMWILAKKGYQFFGLHKFSFIENTMRKIGNVVLRGVSKITKTPFHPNGNWGTEMRFLLGLYEVDSVLLCKNIIKPGMNVLDIGADIGYYTRIFSDLIKEKGKVYAFEPHPKAFLILSGSIGGLRYNNVEAVQIAVSDNNGTATLLETASYGRHSLYDVSQYDERFKVVKKSVVNVITIDDFLAKQGNPKIDFIKLDIEGGEMAALMGMKETLARSENLALMVEFNASAVAASGGQAKEYINRLWQLGFTVREIDKGGKLKDVDQTTYIEAEKNSVNLFCYKNQNHAY